MLCDTREDYTPGVSYLDSVFAQNVCPGFFWRSVPPLDVWIVLDILIDPSLDKLVVKDLVAFAVNELHHAFVRLEVYCCDGVVVDF